MPDKFERHPVYECAMSNRYATSHKRLVPCVTKVVLAEVVWPKPPVTQTNHAIAHQVTRNARGLLPANAYWGAFWKTTKIGTATGPLHSDCARLARNRNRTPHEQRRATASSSCVWEAGVACDEGLEEGDVPLRHRTLERRRVAAVEGVGRLRPRLAATSSRVVVANTSVCVSGSRRNRLVPSETTSQLGNTCVL